MTFDGWHGRPVVLCRKPTDREMPCGWREMDWAGPLLPVCRHVTTTAMGHRAPLNGCGTGAYQPCTEIYKCLTFSVPTMRRVRARRRRSRSRPWAAPWRRRPQETDCRRADRMPTLLARVLCCQLQSSRTALVALTDLVRAWAPPSGMLPPSSPWPCSLPWLLNVPRRHRGHLRTYLLSAHVCRAPTRPVCLALPAARRDGPAHVEPGLARAVERR